MNAQTSRASNLICEWRMIEVKAKENIQIRHVKKHWTMKAATKENDSAFFVFDVKRKLTERFKDSL